MKQSVVVLLAAILFIFSSCVKVVGDGPVITEARPVSNFTGISSEMSARVNFSIAPTFKVEITAQQNIIDVVKTNVINGILHIEFKNSTWVIGGKDIVINITAPSADYFRLSGSGDMDVTGDIVAPDLRLKLSGSGNLKLQKAIVADKIDADLSGSGDVRVLAGTALNLDLKTSGNGKIDMSNLAAENAVMKITGSGDMKVTVSKKLNAEITGSGSVYYHGNPLVTAKITGSGRVQPF